MWNLRGLALVLAVVAAGCGGTAVTPTAPTQSPTQPTPATSTPTFDLSPFVGVWNLRLRLTEVEGSSCVAETMRSQVGVPTAYTLMITERDVTITNSSGDYSCTFDSVKTDSGGFTTYGVQGHFTCERPTLAFRCDDGTTCDLWSSGQGIAARISGTEISGTWESGFDCFQEGCGAASIKAEFSGSR